MKMWSPVTIAVGACAFGASALLLTACHLIVFALTASSHTGMAGSWRPEKLVLLAAFYATTALGLCRVGWILCRTSPQRLLIAGWSPPIILLWTAVLSFLFSIYYPLPYYNHHADKLYLFMGLLFGWSVWLVLFPKNFGTVVESRVLSWIRVGLCNVLLFLVMGEVTLRVADPLLARSGLFDSRYNTPFGLVPHRSTEGSIGRTNASGFRDRERAVERTSTSPRIVALGDSFAWGSGVTYDDTFITVLERQLQLERTGTEVINLGASGFQPDEYLSVLTWQGLQYRPDLVLLNFYIGNDFLPSEGADMVVAGLRWKVHINGNWVHDHFSWDHWYLFHDLTYAYKVGRARLRHATGSDQGIWDIQPGKRQPAAGPAFTGWSAEYLRIVRSRGDQYLRESTPTFESRWNMTRITLEETQRLLQSRHVPWALVLIPAEEQVDGELRKVYLESIQVPQDRLDFEKPQQVLRDWAQSQGVPVIDLSEAFRAEVPRARLFIANDFHWNEAGHAVAAAAILPPLRTLLQTIDPHPSSLTNQ